MSPQPRRRSGSKQTQPVERQTKPRPWPWLSHTDHLWDAPTNVDDEGVAERDATLLPEVVLDREADRVIRMAIKVFQDNTRSISYIQATHRLQEAMDRILRDLVSEARIQGYSWTRIGKALSIGRTAAQKRFREGLTSERQTELEQQTKNAVEWAQKQLAEPSLDSYFLEILEELIEQVTRRRSGEFVNPVD